MRSAVQPAGLGRAETVRVRIGPAGYLGLTGLLAGTILLAYDGWFLMAALACLGLAAAVFPQALLGCLRPRTLVFVAVLALPPVFLLGAPDRTWMGAGYSAAGLEAGIQIGLRFLILSVTLGGLIRRVDISTLAGLLERLGLRGLGFSLGVALNLLPELQRSTTNTWQALRMRGGFRRERVYAAQCLLAAIGTSALRRAEEIALAAEARAYSPDQARLQPVERGELDAAILWAAGILVLGMGFLRVAG